MNMVKKTGKESLLKYRLTLVSEFTVLCAP